jgi:hypothetical protein
MTTERRPNGPKVLVLELKERTSAKGTRYLSGWLGKARPVAFAGEPDEKGRRTWSVYASEPEGRPMLMAGWPFECPGTALRAGLPLAVAGWQSLPGKAVA